MKSQSHKRQHDALLVPEGRFKEPYTPVANRKILSPTLNKYLKYAKFQVSADANVTYRTLGGSLVTAEAITAASGIQPYLVSEIHSVSAGVCYIVHDGAVEQGVDQP